MTENIKGRPVTTAPTIPTSDLAKRYVAKSGWMPLFEVVADRGAKLWAQFELTKEVQELRIALNDLKRATASSTALVEKWEKNYRTRLDIALRDFRGMVREAFVAQRVNADLRAEAAEQHEAIKAQAKIDLANLSAESATKYDEVTAQAKAELEALETRQAEAQAKLDLELTGLGGVKEYQVHTPKKLSTALIALDIAINTVFIGMTLVTELAIGQSAIASGTNRMVGQVLVGALAVFTFILIHVTMKDLRGYVASRGAARRFNKAKKEGHLPAEAKLFPYPSAKTIVALAGLFLLLSSALGLLGYRILVALKTGNGVASDSAGDIVAPFGLVVIIFVTAIYVYSHAHDHTDPQYAEVDRLREAVNIANQTVEAKRLEADRMIREGMNLAEQLIDMKRQEVTELEQPREFSPADTFQEQVGDAKAYYHATMDEAEKEIRDEVAGLEAQRHYIFGALPTYQGTFPLYAAAAIEAMNHLMEEVHDASDETPEPPNAEERKLARSLFAQTAKRTLDGNEEFVEKMIHVSFSPSFPMNERLADFDAVVVEVEAEMNAPEECVPAPAAPAPEPVPIAPPPPRRPNVGTV